VSPFAVRDHHLIDTVEAALPFLDQLGFKRPIAITRRVDLNRTHIGEHRLGPGAIALVRTSLASGRFMFVVAEMLRHLSLQPCFEYVLGQPGQQTVRAQKIHAFIAGTFHQLFSKLLVLRRSRQLRYFDYCLSFPLTQRRVSMSGQQADTPYF